MDALSLPHSYTPIRPYMVRSAFEPKWLRRPIVSPIERVAQGEPDAVRACIDAYGPLVWSLARRLSPSPADAEDAVQEIFLDLWKNASRFDAAVASDVTYVAMIARRRLIDRLRATGRRRDGRDVEAVSAELVDPSADRAEMCAEAALAARAIDQLKPEQREVLLLSTRQGMSHDEIARELEMPLGTVKAHARRGLLRLRAILFGGGSDGGDP